jgi:hypothetical protein
VTNRREFLRTIAQASPLLWLPWQQERRADVVIIGGGLGGCAAALAALRHGLRVILTEPTDWIGGQLTSQAVPPDENAWIETIGGTARYRAYRSAIREWYRQHSPLTERARANPRLNPGNGWVSRLCCEPRVALAVLETELAPFVATGQLQLLLRHEPHAAEVDRDRVRSVTVRRTVDGNMSVLVAPFFVDATELGEVLPMTGTEYVVGAESRSETGEPHAAERAQPGNVQAFTVCCAVSHHPGETHLVDRPADYGYWRDLVLDPPSGPRLLSLDDAPSKRLGFDPIKRTGYWSYRRIVDRDQFTPGTHSSDVTIINWAQNDYSLGTLCDVPRAEADRHVERARALTLSFVYWLQTEAPRPDGGIGWSGLRLRPDVMGTDDGLAKAPYIRESRRIRAQFTVVEQHVTAESRAALTGRPKAELTSERFADSVGIGHYSLDLHRTTYGAPDRYGDTLPFQLPLGALLPVRVRNLLPGAKNIGVTHLTNGCYRLHPIEWNVGESVGELVAFCHRRRVEPHAVRSRQPLMREFQAQLIAQGVPLEWPTPLPT